MSAKRRRAAGGSATGAGTTIRLRSGITGVLARHDGGVAEVRETLLPGVGVRHEFTTVERRAGCGRSPIAAAAGSSPSTTVTTPTRASTVLHLSPDDTRTLAELFGASQVSEALVAVQQQVEGLAIDWLTVAPGPRLRRARRSPTGSSAPRRGRRSSPSSAAARPSRRPARTPGSRRAMSSWPSARPTDCRSCGLCSGRDRRGQRAPTRRWRSSRSVPSHSPSPSWLGSPDGWASPPSPSTWSPASPSARAALAPLDVSAEFISLVAEIGVLLLLLALGLEYSADELRHGLRTGLQPGLFDAVANFMPGFAAGLLLGWDAAGSGAPRRRLLGELVGDRCPRSSPISTGSATARRRRS